MHHFLLFFIAGFVSVSLCGQQLPVMANFYFGDQAISNPAMTASQDVASISVRYQEEWLGFEDAPSTAVVMAQAPLRKQSLSLGGFFMQESQLPLNQTMAGFTYAYHIGKRRRTKSSRRTNGQLSIGLLTAWQQTQINLNNLVLSNAADQSLMAIESNANAAILGAGLYYLSRPGGIKGKSYLFLGAGANQLLVSSNNNNEFINSTTFDGIERVVHSSFVLGYQYFTGQYVVRPSICLDQATHSPGIARLEVQAELPDAYWGAFTYSINQTLAFRFGFILGQEDGNSLRLGMQGVFNVGSSTVQRGLGYSAFAAYVFSRKN